MATPPTRKFSLQKRKIQVDFGGGSKPVGPTAQATKKAKVTGQMIRRFYAIRNSIQKKQEQTAKLHQGNLPDNWQVVFENIGQMVPQMEALANQSQHGNIVPRPEDKLGRFEYLVQFILSNPGTNKNTFAVLDRLREAGLSVQFIEAIPEKDLVALLSGVPYPRQKAQYLKKTATLLRVKHGGDVPRSEAQLMKLAGVGQTTASLVMKSVWGEVAGIAVDVNLHRVANRLQWVTSNSPGQTKEQLQHRLPREHWTKANRLLSSLGQTICLPSQPKCSKCLNVAICPASTCKSGASKFEF